MTLRNTLWRAIAYLVSRPRVVDWLIRRAMRTPYSHIVAPDGSAEVYMERYWLFNPYPRDELERLQRGWLGSFLPSVRLHHIMRADSDRNAHDHPWDARTIILRGFYFEKRQDEPLRVMAQGDTDRILFGEYHKITAVCYEGPWTLFITWKYRGTWGFLVDGVKVPWRTYLGVPPK